MWDKDEICQLGISEKTVESRRYRGGRSCVSRELCMEDGWGTCCGWCRDAVLVIFVDPALFEACRDVCIRQGYS